MEGEKGAGMRNVLGSPFQISLNQALRRRPLLLDELDVRVDRWNRRARDAAFESAAHRLGGEREGQACCEGEGDPEPHRRAGRTMTMEFSRPKSSATSRSARWSGTQRSPSTTNMYS